LVDVREHHEIAAERIPGALAMPLSKFDPANLPKGEVVLSCLGGKRSAAALARCQEAGVAVNTHIRGGLMAWKAAGLPTVRD
jgi:rhodanese-related sulfurtransferase